MPSTSGLTVLVCPLDWGWGHASRMIPIIHLLSQDTDIKVILGVSGTAGQMLQEEFPLLETVAAPSYNISYSKGKSQVWKLALQLPRMILTLLKEHLFLRKLVRQRNISSIISDHRYGLYHKHLVNIMVIHQLKMKFPGKLNILENVFNKIQSRMLQRFDQVWIPDLPGDNNMAGVLSVPPLIRPHYHYIGVLSRFFRHESFDKQMAWHDILVILSGPEPQRSELEKMLFQQLEHTDKSVLIVRGLTGKIEQQQMGNIQLVTRMDTTTMNAAFSRSGVVVCRAGYSSIMDMTAAGKKTILIPTPGQPEQEYLAQYLSKKGYFYSQKQNELNIHKALKECQDYHPPEVVDFSPTLFESLSWLTQRLKNKESQYEQD